MKKAISTIGLFSLVLVLTSFSTPETDPVVTIDSNGNVEIIGSGSAGRNKKVDMIGSGSAGKNKKVDIIGSGSAGKNKKVDE